MSFFRGKIIRFREEINQAQLQMAVGVSTAPNRALHSQSAGLLVVPRRVDLEERPSAIRHLYHGTATSLGYRR